MGLDNYKPTNQSPFIVECIIVHSGDSPEFTGLNLNMTNVVLCPHLLYEHLNCVSTITEEESKGIRVSLCSIKTVERST